MLTALLVTSADGLSAVVNNFFEVCLLYRGSKNTNIYGMPLHLILYHVEYWKSCEIIDALQTSGRMTFCNLTQQWLLETVRRNSEGGIFVSIYIVTKYPGPPRESKKFRGPGTNLECGTL